MSQSYFGLFYLPTTPCTLNVIMLFIWNTVKLFYSVCTHFGSPGIVCLFSMRKSNVVLKVTTTKKYTQRSVTPHPLPLCSILTNPIFSIQGKFLEVLLLGQKKEHVLCHIFRVLKENKNTSIYLKFYIQKKYLSK